MYRIFLSSVQSEFAEERRLLKDYIEKSPLLRRFFSVFIFEADAPPSNKAVRAVYLEELRQSSIYIALIGDRYAGGGRVSGLSATEREYDEATRLGIKRIVLVKDSDAKREAKERKFLQKISKSLTWQPFANSDSLLNWVLSSIDRFMEDEGLFRTLPFDRTVCAGATLADLDKNRIRWFVKKARKERNFALDEDASVEDVLDHLNLFGEKRGSITNAAMLLFGKDPQRWHLSSEVKCVQWQTRERIKPIRSYKVFKGTLFDMADAAVDFVMGKLDYSVGVRDQGPEVEREYDIPESVVSEAIVNAIAHRDYLSTGSVQVELFPDRLEIYNPGTVNPALPKEKLASRHRSFPNNPLLAEPLYLTRYIERLGTGLTDLIAHCHIAGLPKPIFHIDMCEFGIVIYRKDVYDFGDAVSGPVNGPVSGPVNGPVNGPVFSARARLIYDAIARRPGMQKLDLVELTGVGERAIKRCLSTELADFVEFRGAPKTGGYFALNESVNGAPNGPVSGPVNGPVSGPVNGPVNGPVFSDVARRIHDVIVQHPGLRKAQLSELTRINERAVKRCLSKELVGLVTFRGAPKTGGYYAI